MKLAVQLYTVREECKADFIGTLEKVAALGFDGVEFAGYHGVSAEELKGHLDRLGLVPAGAHIGWEQIINNADEVIEYAQKIGLKNAVIPSYPMKSAESVAELAGKMLAVLPKYEAAGMKLMYHNHAYELAEADGKILLDMLAEQTGGKVYLELDLFWVFTGGVDPTEYITKNSKYVGLLHLKDGADGKPTAIGEGVMDYNPIFEAAAKTNTDWMVLENDNPVPTGIEDITRSYNYLKSNFSKYFD